MEQKQNSPRDDGLRSNNASNASTPPTTPPVQKSTSGTPAKIPADRLQIELRSAIHRLAGDKLTIERKLQEFAKEQKLPIGVVRKAARSTIDGRA